MPFNAQLLSGEVFNETPNDLEVIFDEHKDEQKQERFYQFAPILLNPGDEFFFKALVANFVGNISPSVRIIGLNDIENVNSIAYITSESNALAGYNLGVILFMLFCLLAAAPFYAYPSLMGKLMSGKMILVSILIMSLSLVGLLCFNFSIRRLARHPRFGVALNEIIDSLVMRTPW